MAVTIDGKYFEWPKKLELELDDAGTVVLESSASASVEKNQKWHKNLRIFNISGRLRCTTQFKMKMNRFADFFLPIRSLSLKWNWCWCWPISSLCLPFKRLQLWNSHQRVISIVSLVTLMYAWKSHRIQWKWITIHVNNLCSLERATTPHENEQK